MAPSLHGNALRLLPPTGCRRAPAAHRSLFGAIDDA